MSIARSLAVLRDGRAAQALVDFEAVVAAHPASARAHAGRALALAALGRSEEALEGYRLAAFLDPGDAAICREVGYLMVRLGRLDNALAAFTLALEREPGDAAAEEGRVMVLTGMNRHEEARPGLSVLRALGRPIDYLPGRQFHAALNCCDWSDFEAQHRDIVARVGRGERADLPLSFIAHCDSPGAQRQCAVIYSSDRCSAAMPVARMTRTGRRTRVRVAYLSADFREHAVGQLMVGVLERHDRTRFDIVGLAASPADGSPLRRRLETCFDSFLDISGLQDRLLAERIAELGVDILVDLGGHTTGSRTRVLAFRPAPVQVALLGYPGTSGAAGVDYVVGDRHVIPEGAAADYTEQVIYMPDTYMPADTVRALSPPPTRIAAGLPAEGFVYCSFNAPYKLSPDVFAMWMRILNAVPASILWLRTLPDSARHNLAERATKCGVDPARLIYAPRAPTAEAHRARLSLADLFLDTHPYNAHTTASDALAAGVPVLTWRGAAFASRVATSLLHTLGLEELSVDTPADYQRLAIACARSPASLAGFKSRLSAGRQTTPLFDPLQYCRNLESAYSAIWSRHERLEPPAPLWVERCAVGR